MRKKISVIFAGLALLVAIISCRPPWEEGITPVGVTVTSVIEETSETETAVVTDLETETETPIETEESAETEEPEITDTEETPISLSPVAGPEFSGITMFTTIKGWAVTQDRNMLLTTVDGGETWLDATPDDLSTLPDGYTTLSIRPFFLDEYAAWFTPNSANGSMLYHTQDSGVTWTVTPLPFINARYYFLDLSTGYALVDLGAGAGSHYVALFLTMDGGATWTEVFAHEPGESKCLPESGTKGAMTFLNTNTGWIGGNIPMTDYFHLYMTSDGGATWSQVTDISLPVTYTDVFLDVWSPFFMNDDVGYLPVNALTTDTTFYLLIYRTSDSGQTWTYQNAVQDGNAVDFFSIDGGWMAAGTGLLRTTDGGANWTPMPAGGIGAGEVILDVDFVDGQHGWVVTTPNESTYTPLIFYRTTDGGTTWTQLLP